MRIKLNSTGDRVKISLSLDEAKAYADNESSSQTELLAAIAQIVEEIEPTEPRQSMHGYFALRPGENLVMRDLNCVVGNNAGSCLTAYFTTKQVIEALARGHMMADLECYDDRMRRYPDGVHVYREEMTK